MADWQGTFNTISDIIKQGASTYDAVTGRTPAVSTGPITPATGEPAKTVGVDTTQGTTAPGASTGSGTLILLGIIVAVIVLADLVRH
jgi:hypothetical protein